MMQAISRDADNPVCGTLQTRLSASRQTLSPALDLRHDIRARWRTGRSPLRKRTANIENVRNIDIEQRRTLFQLRKWNLIQCYSFGHAVCNETADNSVRPAKRHSSFHQILGEICCKEIWIAGRRLHTFTINFQFRQHRRENLQSGANGIDGIKN